MYTMGVDIGGTNLVAGLVNEAYQIVHKERLPTRPDRTDKEIIGDVIALCRTVMDKTDVSVKDISSIGAGIPGSIDNDAGTVIYSNNIPFSHTPVRAWIQEAFDLPVYLDNDANAAALGETYAGCLQDCDYGLLVTIGTGLGGGIVINRRVYSGFNFAGGEIGHHVIEMDGRQCTCGRLGCWEAYASATGLILDTRRAMEKNPGNIMWQIAGSLEGVNGKTAFDAMRAGDELGTHIVNRYIDLFAAGLVNLVNIFQPEAVALGGGVCHEGETLLAPLRKILREQQYYRGEKQTELRVCKLGNDAGVIGAAVLEKSYA